MTRRWFCAASVVLSCVRTAVALIAPRVLILSMFTNEAAVWYNIPEFNILASNTTIPGLSPLFPQIHCTADGTICQLTTGEGEINAASTLAALAFSPLTNLTQTYFLVAGIAGINPKVATIGSVTFARYAVQVGLQYEIDAREIPSGFSTGYFAQGATKPGQLPGNFYGTEVFEVNEALRQRAFSAAQTAKLNDSAEAQTLRAQYATAPAYATAGGSGPKVVLCDTATSDTYWSGTLLAQAFEGTTKVFTNNNGVYCTTQQEDNATLQALLRGALSHRVDFSRIIIMRSGSDFDRPAPGVGAVASLLGPAPGFEPSVLNLKIAGVKVVQMIVSGWANEFAKGVQATNYVGDVFGSLGGTPDFVPA